MPWNGWIAPRALRHRNGAFAAWEIDLMEKRDVKNFHGDEGNEGLGKKKSTEMTEFKGPSEAWS